MTPLFKKGDEFCKKNYRPVSVLPALNNIFERILVKQLEPFIKISCQISSLHIDQISAAKPLH